MYDLKRVRYVTRHYRDLRGLTLFPFSLLLLGMAAYDAGWIRFSGWLSNGYLLFGVSFLVLFALTVPIERLYDRAFGRVVPDPDGEGELDKRAFVVWWTGGWFIFLITDVVPKLSHIGLLVCITAFWLWWMDREDKHILVLGIVVAAMTLAPLLEGVLGPLYPSAKARDIAIELVTAVGILIIGTMRHLTLVRTLGPIRREEESRA